MIKKIMSLLFNLFSRKPSSLVAADPEAGTVKTITYALDATGNVTTIQPVVDPPPPVQPVIVMPATDTSRKLFDAALALVLKFEGGYVNDPDDPGGETNKGIIKKEYDKYRQDRSLPLQSVKSISDEEVRTIYFCNYWEAGSCNQILPQLAVLHFDSCVNVGLFQAAKFLQRAVRVPDDGKIGQATISAARAVDLPMAITSYSGQRRDFYRNLAKKKPKLAKFLNGWLKRVDQLEEYVNHMNP